MFEMDLNALATRALLERAAGRRAVANEADADLLECAQIYADRFHPSTSPSRPTHNAHDGRERAIVLGGEGCPEIAEFAIAEFAVVIGVSPGVGRDLIADALALRHRFPLTWARIRAGEATAWKARQIVRACTKLDHAAAEYVDRRVAAIIDTVSPHRLGKIADAAKKYADPQRAADEAAEAADERGVFVGRGDKHGNKTIYIKAPAAAVHRHDTAIADIAEALKMLGDTRPIQHRRAEAVGILPDPRFTQELLTQAAQTPTQPTPTQSAPTEPAHSEPAHSEPAHSEPAPTRPARNQPAVTEGRPTDTRSTERRGTESRPSEPWPTESRLSGARPSGARPKEGRRIESRATESPSNGSPSNGSPSNGSASNGAEPVGTDLVGRDDWAGVLEPLGPPDDLWLEAAGPEDPDPLADPFDNCALDQDSHPIDASDEGAPMDGVALRALNAVLAQIKQNAYANPSYLDRPCSKTDPANLNNSQNVRSSRNVEDSPSLDDPRNLGSSRNLGNPHSLDNSRKTNNRGNPVGSTDAADPPEPGCSSSQGRPGAADLVSRSKGQVRPGKTEVVVHLTDHTLASGSGVLRVEGIGPLLAAQLTELVGHGPYVVKPVIDLNDAVSVNAYEIPMRIRERVKLIHPVELFPYGTRETTNTIDLDHIQPYDPLGPPGQTSTTNLAPLGRFGHRVKTHARGWTVHRINDRTLEWTTPHGFTFRVDPEGTHRVDPRINQTAVHNSVRRTNAATVDP
ncbi:DUF222 domain-containing protein [Kribbella sp. NPDC004536]|uniref:DUF222 domain-containing protein n=1 Tax=Kribbella sp. NPDC004536 TaxID=3364106 RepID=UPI003698055A